MYDPTQIRISYPKINTDPDTATEETVSLPASPDRLDMEGVKITNGLDMKGVLAAFLACQSALDPRVPTMTALRGYR